MPPKSRAAGPKKGTRRRAIRRTSRTATHIKSTFNNTIVSITDPNGNVISWASVRVTSASRVRVKSTPFAAQLAAENAARKAQEHGVKKVDVRRRDRVRVARPPSGRCRPRPRGRHHLDVTPQPHNGCRPPKRRRV